MMLLEKAVKSFEANFNVHEKAGYAVGDYEGPVDWSRAPTGDRYVTLTSSGVKKEGEPVREWFAEPEDAIARWLQEARHYAEEKPGTDLYWRDRPELISASFVNLDQSGALNRGLSHILSIEVHFVLCRLALSGKEPAKKVGFAA